MSSVQCLRQFVNERLSCAADEIFRVFQQTVLEYEREIHRQRALLEDRTPTSTELPYLHPHHQAPPHIKEEQGEELQQQEEELQQQGEELQQQGEELQQQQQQFLPFQEKEEELGLDEAPAASPHHQILQWDPEASSGFQRLLPLSESHAPRAAEGAEPQRRRDAAAASFPHVFGHHHTARKSFNCAICGKGFRFRCRLNLHMRTHTGEKLYSCDTCGKRFTQKTNVERHQRIHTGENPYVCKVCGKGFKQVGERNVHLRVHTDERLYCCNTCGKRLKTKQTMLVHMRTHTGERPFVCHTCGRSFIQATTLAQHMRNHAH